MKTGGLPNMTVSELAQELRCPVDDIFQSPIWRGLAYDTRGRRITSGHSWQKWRFDREEVAQHLREQRRAEQQVAAG